MDISNEELADMCEQAAEILKANAYPDTAESVRIAAARLRSKDSERLDWLESAYDFTFARQWNCDFLYSLRIDEGSRYVSYEANDIRAAIDSAMGESHEAD